MIIASIDCFAAFALIGLIVVALPRSFYDIHGGRLRGDATRVAILLTQSGRSRQLTALGAVAFIIFAIARWPLWIPIAVALQQLVSQALIEGVKRLFQRLRPPDWLHRQEAGYSYPSGHSATAVTFFGMWAVVAALSPLPLGARVVLCALFASWGAGIAWSRLALAAHYVTDVLGGLLFGGGWVTLMIGVAGSMHWLT